MPTEEEKNRKKLEGIEKKENKRRKIEHKQGEEHQKRWIEDWLRRGKINKIKQNREKEVIEDTREDKKKTEKKVEEIKKNQQEELSKKEKIQRKQKFEEKKTVSTAQMTRVQAAAEVFGETVVVKKKREEAEIAAEKEKQEKIERQKRVREKLKMYERKVESRENLIPIIKNQQSETLKKVWKDKLKKRGDTVDSSERAVTKLEPEIKLKTHITKNGEIKKVKNVTINKTVAANNHTFAGFLGELGEDKRDPDPSVGSLENYSLGRKLTDRDVLTMDNPEREAEDQLIATSAALIVWLTRDKT